MKGSSMGQAESLRSRSSPGTVSCRRSATAILLSVWGETARPFITAVIVPALTPAARPKSVGLQPRRAISLRRRETLT